MNEEDSGVSYKSVKENDSNTGNQPFPHLWPVAPASTQKQDRNKLVALSEELITGPSLNCSE
jgi:hypothetical protein